MERHCASTSLPGKSLKRLSTELEAWISKRPHSLKTKLSSGCGKSHRFSKYKTRSNFAWSCWTTAAKSPFPANSSQRWMRWKRCCERRKSATPALTDFALIALSSKKPNACAISEGTPKSSSLTSSKESRCTKGKSITAETMYPVVKSTMICDGPPSRLTKSTDAATATGSLRRFIGWSLKRRLMAVSRKFSLGSCNQWAISKETLLRISRKYFLPSKKRTHEGSPPFASDVISLWIGVGRAQAPPPSEPDRRYSRIRLSS